MHVGIRLKGNFPFHPGDRRPPPHERRLEELAAWLRQHCPDTLLDLKFGESQEQRPALYAAFHYFAPYIEIAFSDNTVRVSALTSHLGPGYHQYLCELLQQIGTDLHILWDRPSKPDGTGDPTGFFYSGDRGALEQAMLAWLKVALSAALSKGWFENTPPTLMVPADRPAYLHEGLVTTPLGPRNAGWVREVLSGGSGHDVFPWWHPGLGHYFRGLLLCHMWLDARWDRTCGKQDEDFIHQLERWADRGQKLDPSIKFPLHELDFLRRCLPKSPAPPGEPPRIGYRRGRMRLDVQRFWTMELPGGMSVHEDKDKDMFIAWDHDRLVSVKYFGLDKTRFSNLRWLDENSAPAQGQVVFTFVRPNVAGRAILDGTQRNDKGPIYRLIGLCAAARNTVVTCFVLPRREDLDWAIYAWESLEPPAHFEALYAAESERRARPISGGSGVRADRVGDRG